MNITRKINILFLILTIMLATACAKDKTEPTPKLTPNAHSRCLLLQDSVGGGEINKYFYNNQGKIIRIERSHYYDPKFETMEYDEDGKFLKNNFYTHSHELCQYNVFEYNSSNQVVKVNIFRAQPGGFQPDGHVTLNYGLSGKLEEKNYFIGFPNGPVSKFTYSYLANGSIIEREYYDFFGNDSLRLVGIREYVIDNKVNPYAEFNFLSIQNSVQIEQPTGFSHNILSMKRYDPLYTNMAEISTTYQYNAEGFPVKAIIKEINGIGQRQSEKIFSYTCQ